MEQRVHLQPRKFLIVKAYNKKALVKAFSEQSKTSQRFVNSCKKYISSRDQHTSSGSAAWDLAWTQWMEHTDNCQSISRDTGPRPQPHQPNNLNQSLRPAWPRPRPTIIVESFSPSHKAIFQIKACRPTPPWPAPCPAWIGSTHRRQMS